MALATRYRTVTGIGLVVALILVVIFGSPMYADWVRDNADPNSAGGTDGAAYGLFVGWIVGLATVGARRA